MSDVPVALPEGLRRDRRLHGELVDVRGILGDPAVTSARIVATPESMVLSEARRTLTYLSMFGYHTDALVLNRLVPQGSVDPFLCEMAAAQAEQVAAAISEFSPLPVIRASHAPGEIRGVEALAAHGRELWGATDPLCRPVPQAPRWRCATRRTVGAGAAPAPRRSRAST
ncbi:MAG: ArsA-related P-loop ATPase [Microthrixaceae bacterium]